MYDPKTNKFPYPEDTSSHYIKFKKQVDITFDDKYSYIDKSKGMLFKQSLIRIVLRLIVFPMTRIRLGLKINGKDNIKKYKDVINNGIISCCNHIHFWDYLGILVGIKPYKPYYLVWDKNIRGESGNLIRLTKGVPIPNTVSGTRKYYEDLGNHLNGGGWIHIYPEGSMWEFYRPIRPFKRGLSYLAIKYNKPILPMVFTYRKPGFIRSKIFHQIATLTLNIGEPIYANYAIDKKIQEDDLTIRCHEAMCKLAGIENNIYDEIYDNSKKIDY